MQSFFTEEGHAFLVGRIFVEADAPLEAAMLYWLESVVGENATVELEPPVPSKVGPLDALDAHATVYDGDEADYFRLRVTRYYDRALVFAFSGPAADAEKLGALAERTTGAVQFRRQ